MTDITVLYCNSSYVQLVAKLGIIKELKEHFSFYMDGYQFSPKFLYSNWDGKINLITPENKMPFGLVDKLLEFAQSNFLEINIAPEITEIYDLSRDDFNDWINSKTYYAQGEEIYPYWYQLDAIYQSLVHKRRILNLPTSAGKSLIQALLTKYTIEHSDRNILILVPTIDLVIQMKNDFIDYNLFKDSDIGEIRSGVKDSGERVIISTWQSAVKKPKAWFSQFGMLLCDEMHLSIGKSISEIITKLDQCEYKIGLSGSLKDGKANYYQYLGLYGKVYQPTTTLELMEQGQISKICINTIFLKYPEKVSKAISGVNYDTEIKFAARLPRRTNFISKLAIKLASLNENIFVMFVNVKHGKSIVEELKALGHEKVFFVAGEVSGEDRTKIKEYLEQNTGAIVVASYGTFSTGVSVKNLHHVIFAAGFKSKIRILQTIGRSLRKHKSKKVAKLWDIIDDMSITVVNKDNTTRRINVNHLLKHGIERIKRYSLEGYNYNIKEIDLIK